MTSNHDFKDSGRGEDTVFCFYLVMGAGRELQKIKADKECFLEAPSEATVSPLEQPSGLLFPLT